MRSGGVEDAGHETAAHALDGVEEHPLPLVVDVVGLLQKSVFRHEPLRERPGVFRETERGVGAELLGEIHRVIARV